MTPAPYIPETAPFTSEQRAWLNGFLAGLFANQPGQGPVPLHGASVRPGEPLAILFGSQTGTAEGLAKRLARESEQRGFTPHVLELNDFEEANLIKGGKAVIISSTWGDGDPPDNAVNFWNWLKADSAPRLENLHFAVLGLGDRNYADFCGASKKFDERLAALGACRLAARGECDVDYETPAKSWIDGLWDKLGGAAAVNGAALSVQVNGHDDRSNGEPRAGKDAFSKSNPFPARLLRNLLLNKPGSGKEVRHFELGLEGSELGYEVGDALGIAPVNCPELVDALLAALHCGGDEPVEHDGFNLLLREALARHFDITKPSRELLAIVAQSAANQEMAALLAPEKSNELSQWLRGRDVLDLIRALPTPPSLTELLAALRTMAPRLYSIASSPRTHPGEAHLTVSTVRYESFGRGRKGVASTFLADRVGDAGRVKVFVQSSPGFKLPANAGTPIIMVGPGTGVAPFRAFLEDRQATDARGKNWLFFGDQKRATDFLYEEQLIAWLNDGHLTRLDLAFSRDQADKLYVQHRMLQRAAELWAWLEAGAHFYVCGDAGRMAKDVDSALHKIIETAGGKSQDEARDYVTRLKSQQRYQRDTY